MNFTVIVSAETKLNRDASLFFKRNEVALKR
jgi:hypothetical protein